MKFPATTYVDYFAGLEPKWATQTMFPATALPKAPAAEPVVREQRQHPRRPLDQHPVQVVCGYGTMPAELVDLSVTGAKVRLLAGFGPNAGEEITVRLADGVERHGAVAWIDGAILGISLRRPLPRALD